MSLTDRLRNFDSHSSVSKEFRVYTSSGAVLSIVTLAAIFYFVTSEFAYNFQVTLQERVHVNATSPTGLELEFDISLPEIPCGQLNVDASDPNDQKQSLHLDGDHHVWKHRMRIREDGTRVLIGDRQKLELGSTMLNDKDFLSDFEETIVEGGAKNGTAEEKDECGDCYGAGEEDECCNTCDEVRSAYKRKGWHLRDMETIKQCITETSANEANEGCNVHGVVALSTGGGNLHLAPGKDMDAPSFTLFDLLLEMFATWNVTHQVHKIRFGPEYPAAVYQLDGATRSITDTYGMYQYYFQVRANSAYDLLQSCKRLEVPNSPLPPPPPPPPSSQVVPTLYRFRNGTTIQTNQYSVTEHLRHVSPGSGRGMPGVFFFYEVSPLHVEISEVYVGGWVAFFTSVCAVIGGVVTLLGLVDQHIFASKHKQRELVR